MLGGGYGLRLFLGFAAVVVVMLVVTGAVLVSVFGSYPDELNRSELRAAANAVRIDIAYSLSRAERRTEVAAVIREHAARAGLIVLLLDSEGRVIEGFEPLDHFRGLRLDVTAELIAQKWTPDGWFETKMRIGNRWRPVVARLLGDVALSRRDQPREGMILAVTFGDEHPDAGTGELIARPLIAGLAGLLAAVVVAALLSRSLTRPLRALTAVVSSFGPDRYEARAKESGPTQIRELARAFNAMAGRVAANERAMHGFIADVSHELRTPLTSIRGFAEALRDGTVSEPDRRAHIRLR